MRPGFRTWLGEGFPRRAPRPFTDSCGSSLNVAPSAVNLKHHSRLFASVCRLLRPVPARCHSKCHWPRASSEFNASETRRATYDATATRCDLCGEPQHASGHQCGCPPGESDCPHGGAKEATLFAIGSSTKSFTTMAGVISQDQVELARRFTGYFHKP